jgi:hypothetical protein
MSNVKNEIQEYSQFVIYLDLNFTNLYYQFKLD